MTYQNQTPIGFTPNAAGYLKGFIERATGRKATNEQIAAYFDGLAYFHPDGSAHIELGSDETLSNHPEVASFDADDFIYA